MSRAPDRLALGGEPDAVHRGAGTGEVSDGRLGRRARDTASGGVGTSGASAGMAAGLALDRVIEAPA
jgi:hypothetical protein